MRSQTRARLGGHNGSSKAISAQKTRKEREKKEGKFVAGAMHE